MNRFTTTNRRVKGKQSEVGNRSSLPKIVTARGACLLLLTDIDAVGVVLSEFGEVVSSECEFQKEGCVCFFFERTAFSWWRRRWIGSAADPNVT